MKTTVIPAQITSVEDKIDGNLSVTQILLLLSALFLASIMYLLFPQQMKLTAYKLPLIIVIVLTCLLLAVRIKDKIVLQWLVVLSIYSLRPRYYIFNKNDATLREISMDIKQKEKKTVAKHPLEVKQKETISFADSIAIEQLLLHPKRQVRFAFRRKGGIDVSIS